MPTHYKMTHGAFRKKKQRQKKEKMRKINRKRENDGVSGR